MTRHFHSGIPLMAAAALLWSTGGVGIQALSLDGATIAAYRGLFSGLVFLPFFRPRLIRWTWTLALFLAVFVTMSSTFVIANRLTAAANVIALQYTSVFWVFLVEEVLPHRRMPRNKILPLGLVLVAIGCFFSEPDTGTNLLGNALALVSGITFGMVAVLMRRMAQPHSISLAALANFAVFPVLWAGSGFTVPDVPLPEWGILIALGVVQMGVSYVLVNRALRSITALTANFVSLVEPLCNPLWVLLLLGHMPTGFGMAGWGCLMLSLVLYLRVEYFETRTTRKTQTTAI